MTEKKKLGGEELEGLDWDSALAEWEEKTFLPEVAKDKETSKPATLTGTPTPPPAAGAKPLYRPPTPPPPAPTKSVQPTITHLDDLTEDMEESGATVIAAIPRELLRGAGKIDDSPKSARGGLGQMFARGPEKRDDIEAFLEETRDQDLENAPTISRRPSDPGIDDTGVITSAKHVELRQALSERREPPPRARPSQVSAAEAVPDGALFDPFAEPDPFLGSTSAATTGTANVEVVAELTPMPATDEGSSEKPKTRSQQPTAHDIDAPIFETLEEEEIDEASFHTESKGENGTAPSVPSGPHLHSPSARAFDPNDDTSSHLKGAIHVPSQREYDPNEETSVLSKAALPLALGRGGATGPVRPGSSGEVDLVGVGEEVDDDQDEPTNYRRRGTSSGAPKMTLAWEDERPAQERLTEAARAGFAKRAEWLEAEARATQERNARARALLAVSELRAILGEAEQAEILAREASALAPQLALAPRQARALSPSPRDTAATIEALDAEVRQSPTPASRLHGALLAADFLRLSGDYEGATKRWDQALKIAPTDPRAPIARAARALAAGDSFNTALRLPDAPELAPLAEAAAAALKLRGIERKDVTSDAFLPADALRRARESLVAADVGGAASSLAELAKIPELAEPAAWLAASLGATRATTSTESIAWLHGIHGTTSRLAQRAAAARGVELADNAVVQRALESGAAFEPIDRAVLAALLDLPSASHESMSADLDALATSDALRPMVSALAAVGTSPDRADRVAGTEESRRAVKLARLLAADASPAAIEEALAAMAGDHDDESRAVALEMAARSGRFDDVSDALAAWSGAGDVGDDDAEDTSARDRQLAAAMVAERAGDRTRAIAAYEAALRLDGGNEAALRALIALAPETDAVIGLTTLAGQVADGPRAAMARVEAATRAGPSLDDAARVDLLEQAHRAAPALPFAAFLAERVARRHGDVEAALRWIRERRAASGDAIENAIDGVREALFVAESDPELATTRLEEAHHARPSDVALREIFERMSTDPISDRGAWREQRAAAASGAARALLFTEAAHEHERAGDKEATLRAATAAREAGDDALGKLALERAELESGTAARLADELLAFSRATEDPRDRREAYERLADLDAIGRDDAASALLWHRSILEEQPDYKPSLRHVEHALLNDGRDDELEPCVVAIARVLAPAGDGECTAHAGLAMRLRMRGAAGEWEPTRAMAELAAAQPHPALWALRAANAHARAAHDEAALARTFLGLSERTTRAPEIATLMVRAAESHLREERVADARALLDRAATEDPGDVVTWGHLADVRQRTGDARGAAEACESLARTSVVEEHQLLAWYDAGRIWLDEAHDPEHGTAALEQAASIDVTFQDVFARLSALYAQRGARSELAALLERRLERVSDPDERVSLEVERGRALTEIGDPEGARAALQGALDAKPDHTGALAAFADLCASQKDWDAAEQAWVRLSRLLPLPDDQRAVYARLGELYAVHSVNLSRAEVALKEVLKRAPDDMPTHERLVDVYRRQNDGTRAVETQQQILKLAASPEERRKRLVELAAIFETTMRDPRKAEQALESARREAPHDVGALRALAEFYQRQRQMPAVNIMLDRASADARRALAAGRFTPALFEVMQAVFDLRGKRDAARAVAASLAAIEGRPAPLQGAEGRAGDPRLDDLLAPEALSTGLRALLSRTGDALDIASALDLRALQVTPLPTGQAQSRIAALATSMGLPPVQVLVSPQLGRVCVPSASAPPAIVVGEALVKVMSEPAAAFLILRALKLVQAHASALVRTPPQDLIVLVAAWLQACNPSWTAQGLNAAALADAVRRVQAGMPRHVDADVGTIALEVGSTIGPHASTLGPSAMAWANRVALVALGDPSAALEGIAWSLGANDGAPREKEPRVAWAAKTAEAKDLLVFSVSDAYAEVRARLQLDRG